jgi:hypothetical protein
MKKANQPTNQVKSKRPAKAAKVSSKVKTAPTKARRLGGASAATGRPPWNSPNWGQAWDKFLWGEFEQILATSKRTPKRQEELRKRYREKLTGWIKNMVDIRTASDAKWASMPTPPQVQVQAAEAECEALIAAHLQELEAEQDLKQATGRRAFTALTLQDAGYSLAAEIAGGDGQLEISLEALALWLQELLVPAEHGGFRVFVDTEFFSELTRVVVGSDIGNSIPEKESDTGQTPRPRWRTMPEGSFRHHPRNSQYGHKLSYVELNNPAGEWLWRELARSAFEDAEAAKVLSHLLGWHQDAAMKFLQRFVKSRHKIRDNESELEPRERLLKTAAAMISGDSARISATSKQDKDRIQRDYKPEGK